MSGNVVRRRRAVLAALVLISLFLLTAYFGESSGGSLHSVQRGAMEVFAPIQEGANRALKPFRDLFGWFGDTLDAKEERDRLKAQNERARRGGHARHAREPAAAADRGAAGAEHRGRARRLRARCRRA